MGAIKRVFTDPNLGHLNTFLCGSQTVSKGNLQIEGGKKEQGHTLRLRIWLSETTVLKGKANYYLVCLPAVFFSAPSENYSHNVCNEHTFP